VNRRVSANPFRLLVAIGLFAGLFPAMSWTVRAAMSSGSIQGLEGWSGGTIPIAASVDQSIDQTGHNQRTGTGSWRISNNTASGNHNGSYAGWAFGPGLATSAGQPSSGAGADQFSATLWFRSATASADGSNIEIDLGTVAGDDRNTFLALTNKADASGGLQLRAGEPDGSTGDFLPTAVLASGITRADWHRLDIVAKFHDGLTNDTVEYALDGVALVNPATSATTFGTFEGFREGLTPPSPYVLSNRLFFRSGAAPSGYGAFADTTAQGFYFDDVSYSVATQSSPDTTLASYATGFEPGMILGSAQGQEGWSGGTLPIAASVDQVVYQAGPNHRTGIGAWRISNNTALGDYNGNFAGWVFGPGLSVSAGQRSSAGGADQFRATLWFHSASASADGSNIEIDLGTVAGDDRNTFLALTNKADDKDGLQLRAGEPDGSTGDFRPTVVIASNITRVEWHRLDIVANFHDGAANDTVEYALDGVALANPAGGTTFGTFEGYRDGTVGASYALSNRLYFRSGAAPSGYGAFADTAAKGFYFDDVSYSVANHSAPGTPLASYATGFEPARVPAPELTISESYTGSFARGQHGAQLTITVTNSGNGPSSGLVTVVDQVPVGLAPTAAGGTGWSCNVVGQTVTCSRRDVLASGAAYAPVTIAVNVAVNAPASVSSTATVSGGGNTANSTATDVTRIAPARVGRGSHGHDNDFDGDGKTDISVFRSATGEWPAVDEWYIVNSTTGSSAGQIEWGLKGDVPVPGDYDGDGKTDVAVYRPAKGQWPAVSEWYVIQSTTGSWVGTIEWGLKGDVPVPADYDGDGKTDIAVYRPSTHEWYIIQSTKGSWVETIQFGLDGDVPVPADYDGDGKADIAVYHPAKGQWPAVSEWRILQSTTGTPVTTEWGLMGDTPVPADYDGDGKADIAVYRPAQGQWPAVSEWYIIPSTTGAWEKTIEWGLKGDVPVPADYDGDGKTDIAVFRPGTREWYIIQSTRGSWVGTIVWGLPGDVPMTKR